MSSFALAVREVALARPTDLAVVQGAVRWSWAELDARVDAAARRLAAAGVGPRDRVLLLAAPTPEAVAALHAIARIGAVAAPLSTDLTPGEVARATALIEPRIVVDDAALTDLVDVRPGGDSGPALPAAAPIVTPADAPAVVVLTSGTTGGPKPAVLSVAAMTASAAAWLAFLPPASGWLLALGLGHVAGLGVVWRAALSGVPVVIASRGDTDRLLAALRTDPRPSHVSLVPTQLARLLDSAGDARPPEALRAVLLGGGTVPPALVRRAIRAGWPVVPTYGLTEAGSGVTALPSAEAGEHPASAGRALPGVNLRIDAPGGDGVGHIEVRSPALFSGYLGDPAATAAALGPNGWLRTGDLGRLDPEGRLDVLDRRTDRIVRGGENVSPLEVEAVLLEHPAVTDAAVVARRDEVLGQVPIAAIVLRRGDVDPGDDALAGHCRRRLAQFKVPAAFIRLEALPRTSGGKLRRGMLRDQLDAAPVARIVGRPDGARIAYRRSGTGSVAVLLLHGTLSTAAQLGGLAEALAGSGDFTVLAVDRRGSGESRLPEPAPLPVEVHVDDLIAVLDAEGAAAAAVVGISFGGVVALELAARRPARTRAVVAWEPPYGPLADPGTQRAFEAVARATDRAFRDGGAALAAEIFLRGVAGDDAWRRLGDRARTFLAGEGGGALVDSALVGLDPDGLSAIDAPVTLLTGDASEPFYGPIADTLAARLRGGRRVRLPGLGHAGPLTAPGRVAEALIRALRSAGASPPEAAGRS
jgi:O-succinylbenzoic acid--CoA ligase